MSLAARRQVAALPTKAGRPSAAPPTPRLSGRNAGCSPRDELRPRSSARDPVSRSSGLETPPHDTPAQRAQRAKVGKRNERTTNRTNPTAGPTTSQSRPSSSGNTRHTRAQYHIWPAPARHTTITDKSRARRPRQWVLTNSLRWGGTWRPPR